MRWVPSSLLGLALSFAVWTSPVGAVEISEATQQEIQQAAASIRELAPKQPVPTERATPEQLRAYFLEEMNDPETLALLATSGKYNVLLGLLPPELDLHQLVVNTLAGAVAGQYQYRQKRMVLTAESDGSFGPEAKLTIAHEFTHALQDQYFDIGNLSELVKEEDDRSMALRALFEGDATLTEIIYAREHLSTEEIAAIMRQEPSGGDPIETAPFILREELRFPYTEGFYFVTELWQQGGYAKVNEAYVRTPVSTEQIMHTDKYLVNEQPIAVTISDQAVMYGPGWTQTYSNVMGELELRILIENFTDTSTGERAAAGWGGDAFAVYEGPGNAVSWVLDSRWDTEKDASEFYDAFALSLDRRFRANLKPVLDEQALGIWETPVTVVNAGRRGAQVVIVYAPERAQSQAMFDSLAPSLVPASAVNR